MINNEEREMWDKGSVIIVVFTLEPTAIVFTSAMKHLLGRKRRKKT